MTTPSLLIELFVEELPPKALKKLGAAFADVLADSLKAQGFVAADAAVTPFASPRRLAVHVTAVAAQTDAKNVSQKLMPVTVGLDAAGQPTPALLKKLQSLGADASAVAGLQRAPDGKAEALFYTHTVPGMPLAQGLQKALDEALAKLPVPKVMTYPMQGACAYPGWTTVSFVRPVHSLLALHGSTVLPVKALGLQAGNSTQGHRFEAQVCPLVIAHADAYAQTLAQQGAVIASFAERKAEITRQLAAAAQQVGGGMQPIDDDALLDEVTALVERPHVLVCQFDPQFLTVPQECLILTMKANQKYFPLLNAQGQLSHQFLVVSNISPPDASAVIGGNERVVRPRLADAQFFFEQDKKKTLAARLPGLDKVVYQSKLGSQGERIERVRAIARGIAKQLGDDQLVQQTDTAARLAKADLLTDMVGEFPELQGTMGRYYALHDGLSAEIADAIEDHYKPRFAGDTLPRNTVGVVLALADKLETLAGMFGIGNLPTGDRDPFALRRHALGVVRLLIENNLPLALNPLLNSAVEAFGGLITAPRNTLLENVRAFIDERLAGSLREQGYSAQEVEAVLALHPQRLGDIPQRLAAVRSFAALPEAPALAAANKRIANILKKVPEVDAHVSPVLLQETAEIALHQHMQTLLPQAQAQFQTGDYTASLQTLAALRAPVDAFFADVMVNAEALDLRLNRQGLLKSLHQAMNQVADLSKLAS